MGGFPGRSERCAGEAIARKKKRITDAFVAILGIVSRHDPRLFFEECNENKPSLYTDFQGGYEAGAYNS